MKTLLSGLVLASLLVTFAVAQDACKLSANYNTLYFGTPDSVGACFKSIPPYPKVNAGTMYSLNQLIDLYSFTDIVKDSGAPYNFKVDLRAEFERINSTKFSNDYDFHISIAKVMNQLMDAHTLYRLPGGYSSCFYIRPYTFDIQLNANGRAEYFLRSNPLGPNGDLPFLNILHFDAAKYRNLQVIKLNGQDPEAFLTKIAETYIGYYKDINVRFNQALVRAGQTPLGMYPLEGLESVTSATVVLADGTTQDIQIPNAGVCNQGGFSSTDAFINRCSYSRSANQIGEALIDDILSLEEPEITMRGRDMHKELNEFVYDGFDGHFDTRVAKTMRAPLRKPLQRSPMRASTVGSTTNIPNVPGSASRLSIVQTDRTKETVYMKYTTNSGKVVPAFYLESFAPTDVHGSMNVLNAMLADAKSNNYEDAIFDMTGNGGGIICVTNLVLSMLVPNWTMDFKGHAYGLYDVKEGEIAKTFTKNSVLSNYFLSPDNYVNPTTLRAYTDFSFFTNAVTRTRGGTVGQYSTQAFFPGECDGFVRGDLPGFRPVDYKFKRILIVTDGACGSACSLFISQLQGHEESKAFVKVVSFGGRPSNTDPMETSSFAGGNVLDWSTVATVTSFSGATGPLAPKSFPSNALGRFNFNEYYLNDQATIPREFMKLPADYHIAQWDRIVYSDVSASNEAKTAFANLYETTAAVL